MSSSMVWFPAPETIDPKMLVVLEYEKMLLSNPLSAVITLFIGVIFVILACLAFWKHSLKMGCFKQYDGWKNCIWIDFHR
jgi:hypothetical protein